MIEILALAISALALGVSLYTLWVNRKVLIVEFDEELLCVNWIYRTAEDAREGKDGKSISPQYLATVRLMNPSQRDVLYFNVGWTLYDKDKKALEHLGVSSMPTINGEELHQLITPLRNGDVLHATICDDNRGVSKAQSFENLDYLSMVYGNEFYEREDVRYLELHLQTSQRGYAKNSEGLRYRWFKAYRKCYDLEKDVSSATIRYTNDVEVLKKDMEAVTGSPVKVLGNDR